MIVVDTSVWLNLFLDNENRRKMAVKVFELCDGDIYEPEVFKVEMAGTLARRFRKEDVVTFLKEIMAKLRIIENPNEFAFTIAIETGCRAVDAYFIATAKLTNSVLITNDKTMANNAKKAEIEAYYLLEEYEEVMKRLSA